MASAECQLPFVYFAIVSSLKLPLLHVKAETTHVIYSSFIRFALNFAIFVLFRKTVAFDLFF